MLCVNVIWCVAGEKVNSIWNDANQIEVKNVGPFIWNAENVIWNFSYARQITWPDYVHVFLRERFSQSFHQCRHFFCVSFFFRSHLFKEYSFRFFHSNIIFSLFFLWFFFYIFPLLFSIKLFFPRFFPRFFPLVKRVNFICEQRISKVFFSSKLKTLWKIGHRLMIAHVQNILHLFCSTKFVHAEKKKHRFMKLLITKGY